MTHRILLAFLLGQLFSCQTPEKPIETNPAVGKYIYAFTSGTISKNDPILIKLANPYQGNVAVGQELAENILEFSPDIHGKLFLRDASTLEFVKSESMPSGQDYVATLHLDRLLDDVESELNKIQFEFSVIKQDLDFYIEGIEPVSDSDLTKVKLKARILFADAIETEEVKAALSAKQRGNTLSIAAQQTGGREYTITVDGLQRLESASELVFEWDFSDLDLQGEEVTEIPSISDFKVLSMGIEPNVQELKILFSDPIAEQDLNGLISIEHAVDLKFDIDGAQVTVFTNDVIFGDRLVEVSGSVRNKANKAMGDDYSKVVRFAIEKPDVKLLGDKNIIPMSGSNLLMPFEAVGLNAVDVYVTKIFSNNILQYFQSNDYGGSYQLSRVGKHIYRKHIDLSSAVATGLYNKQRYFVDIADIVKSDPGALYEVDIRFKKEYSLYDCGNEESTLNDAEVKDGWVTDGEYFVDDYWANVPYNWRERENPCHGAYYNRYQTSKKTTVMATDIGLIVKAGNDNKMLVVANSLTTAEPISGAKIRVFDFQQQEICSGSTDGRGFVELDLKGKPFVVSASKGKSVSYVKVFPGNALSLSKFRVSGAVVQDGVKGFAYGDRGVWRPGDSLYLNFILDDPAALLPPDYPVKMEIYSPQGQPVKELVQTASVNGFYDFRTHLPEDSETGNYAANFTIGNRVFRKNLRIETVKPNRLKIELNLDEKGKSTAISGKLKSSWLHGTPGNGLNAKIDVTIKASKTVFDEYPGYHFDNYISSRLTSSDMNVFEDKLDENGEASFRFDVDESVKKAPGRVKASFTTKVFEPGGNFSIDYFTSPYDPYSTYVGARIPESKLWGGALETEKDHEIELVSLTADGKLSKSQKVKVSLFKVDHRWWYDNYSSGDYNYINTSSYNLVDRDTINLLDGTGAYPIRVENSNWGRYLLEVHDLASGHKSVQFVFFDWPYWMRSNKQGGEASSILGFSTDKDSYKVGEKIKVTVPSPEKGKLLLSLENGTEIIDTKWITPEKGETKIEIEATTAMAPNAYIHISLIQPHSQTVNDRPMRMYGVIPVDVIDEATKLEPIIKTAEVFRPESKADISVKEANGKPMTYTLAVVDEGLLGITRFNTPNPWDAFFAKEALGVRTWDFYDQVIGAIAQKNPNVFAIGGDGEAMDPGKQKAIRFKPMVRFLGPFTIAANESKKHQIDIPNYVGAVRVMVVAGNGAAYGNAESEVPVRSKLMVLGTLPRVASPTEKIHVPVNVFAMEDGIESVDVSIRTNELLTVKGSKQKSIQFDKPGDQLVDFEIETSKTTGIAKVFIEARSESEKSTYEIEFDVRSPNPNYTEVIDTLLNKGGTWKFSEELFGVKGSNKAVLELSVLPPLNLSKRLDYLIQYPHGCVEQITSSAFPQISLHRLVELSTSQKVSIDKNVQEVIRRYSHYQTSDGGFGYWPGSTQASEWGTNYAGHFMLQAEKRGYYIPSNLKNQWISYQREMARKWPNTTTGIYTYGERIQAYRLFTLALADQPNFGAMNTLKSKKNLDATAHWILALAYAESGEIDIAKKMVEDYSDRIPRYNELGHTYGNPTRDAGFVLQALNLLNEKERAASVAQSIATIIGSETWLSTQTLGMTLVALAEYIGEDEMEAGLKGSLIQNGDQIDFNTGKSLVQQELALSGNKVTGSVSSSSEQPLYARLLISGKPLISKEVRKANKLRMEIRYVDMNYRTIDVSSIEQGTDFIAEVRISNPEYAGTLHELALTQVFPSGWEIMNPRMVGELSGSQNTPDYQDVRDDRVHSYFSLREGKSKTFRIQLNATYKGKYYLPAVKCAPMYDESIIAVEPGKWVEVK